MNACLETVDLDRVAETEVEGDALPLGLRPVPHHHDLERLAEARRHPGDHVGDEGASEPMQRPVCLLLGRAFDAQLRIDAPRVQSSGTILSLLQGKVPSHTGVHALWNR